jgi:hypothetical protein
MKQAWDGFWGLVPLALFIFILMTGLGEYMWYSNDWRAMLHSLGLGVICCYRLTKSEDVTKALGENMGTVINPIGTGGDLISLGLIVFSILVFLKSLSHCLLEKFI